VLRARGLLAPALVVEAMHMLRLGLVRPARVEGDAEGVAASPRAFLPRGGCALLRARGLLAPALLVEAVQMLRLGLMRPARVEDDAERKAASLRSVFPRGWWAFSRLRRPPARRVDTIQVLRGGLVGPALVEGDAEGVAASPRSLLPRRGLALRQARAWHRGDRQGQKKDVDVQDDTHRWHASLMRDGPDCPHSHLPTATH